MINIIKSIVIGSFFLLTFLFGTVYNLNASNIQNKYLLVTVDDESGRIFLSTIQGKPDVKGDEKKSLLFYDKPPSSYTLIYLDDDILTFGDDIGRFKPPIADLQSIKLKWLYRFISATQEVKFVKRKSSGIEDGVLIKYTVKNEDNKSHMIGLRILFDTFLGENSKYHFELSNGEKLGGEKSFNKENLPGFWISKDKKGIVCLRGVLKESSVTVPDKVIFANYKALSENPKDYYIKRKKDFDYPPYSRNDSAVALYFNSVRVEPGKERVVYTILGLCGVGEYEAEKPIVELPTPKEKIRSEKNQNSSRIIYHVKDYDSFRKEIENISKLKNDINSIDVMLKRIDSILDKRSKGENVTQDSIKDLEKELREY